MPIPPMKRVRDQANEDSGEGVSVSDDVVSRPSKIPSLRPTRRLFPMIRIRKPEYWQCIQLVAPSEDSKIWKTNEAVGAWCLKCDRPVKWKFGESHTVQNHMEKFHPEMIQEYRDRNGIAEDDMTGSFDGNQQPSGLLFKMKRVRKPQYWKCIRLVAPTFENKQWKTTEAVGAWCTRCNKSINWKIGESHAVQTHMERSHRALLVSEEEAGGAPLTATEEEDSDFEVSPDHVQERLYNMKRVRKPEYWQCIKLVAPSSESREWKSTDAVGAWCTKCERSVRWKVGETHTIQNHMHKYHEEMLPKMPVVTEEDRPPPVAGVEPTGTLFKMKKVRKPEYWQCIELVAPSKDNKEWKTNDATGAWCTKCRVPVRWKYGESHAIQSHMEKYHPSMVRSFMERNGLCITTSSSTSAPTPGTAPDASTVGTDTSRREPRGTLFKMKRVKKPEYWQCIELIAPTKEAKNWKTSEAIGAWCTLCEKPVPWKFGESHTIQNHMEKFHSYLVLKFKELHFDSSA